MRLKLFAICIFAACSIFSPILHAATNVGGVIYSDTIWDPSGSPYYVTANIFVDQNATLTIKPGVSVIFRSPLDKYSPYSIIVAGTLNAQGTKDSPIIFTAEDKKYRWGAIKFLDTSTPWDSSNSSGSIISYSIIEYGGNSLDSSIRGSVEILSASPMISNNVIRFSGNRGIVCERYNVVDSKQIIIGNYIYGNEWGILCAGSAEISNNYIAHNGQGIYVSVDHIDFGEQPWDIQLHHNTIIGAPGSEFHGGALRLDIWGKHAVSIRENKITNMNSNGYAIAIFVERYYVDNLNMIDIYRNNFIKIHEAANYLSISSIFEIQKPCDLVLNMQNNWWGTSSVEEIDAMIVDYKDDYSRPLVNYLPISEGYVSGAGSSLEYHNLPPVANAGPDQVVFDSVTLDGSGSFDPDGSIAAYEWRLYLRNHLYMISAEGVKPTIKNIRPGFYDVVLTVVDNDGIRSSGDVMELAVAGSCTADDMDRDGYSSSQGDCDDMNSDVFPDAVELPGNFIDENCDGSLGKCDPGAHWKTHGEFVACVTSEVHNLVNSGVITKEQGNEIINNAAQSSVGKN